MDPTQKVIEIIVREQHLDPGKVSLDSTFGELGIDSLDGVNILFALEEEFKLDIPDSVAQNMKSVRQVVESLTRRDPTQPGVLPQGDIIESVTIDEK